MSDRIPPVLNPGSVFTNFSDARDVLCVLEVHSCNGESQDGMRARATSTGTSYDVGAAFVLEPFVRHLVKT